LYRADQRRDSLAQSAQGEREEQRKENNLQHFTLCERAHNRVGDNIHQEFDSVVMLGRCDVCLDR